MSLLSSDNRVFVFGAGEAGRRVVRQLGPDRVVCFLDNSPSKHGTRVDGIEVRSPAEIERHSDAAVIVASMYEDQIVTQLLAGGVSADRIHLSEVLDPAPPPKDPFPWGFFSLVVAILTCGGGALVWLTL